MSNNIITTKLITDIATNIVTTTVQFGEPSPLVVGPFVMSDIMYSLAIKDYITDNYGSNVGLTDEFSRDVIFKTILTGFNIWIAQTFSGEGVGLLSGTLNALVSYTASNGVQELLDDINIRV